MSVEKLFVFDRIVFLWAFNVVVKEAGAIARVFFFYGQKWSF